MYPTECAEALRGLQARLENKLCTLQRRGFELVNLPFDQHLESSLRNGAIARAILFPRPNTQFQANFDLWVFTLYLSSLLICVGFGAATRFNTHHQKLNRFVCFYFSVSSTAVCCNTTRNKQDYLLYIAY